MLMETVFDAGGIPIRDLFPKGSCYCVCVIAFVGPSGAPCTPIPGKMQGCLPASQGPGFCLPPTCQSLSQSCCRKTCACGLVHDVAASMLRRQWVLNFLVSSGATEAESLVDTLQASFLPGQDCRIVS